MSCICIIEDSNSYFLADIPNLRGTSVISLKPQEEPEYTAYYMAL